MLWDEYIEHCPEGYRYSRFCELYRNWASRLSVTMRQAHIGGDKLFVDYAGDTVPVIVDRLTGKRRPAQIFVAVMGASNFTYAEASWTQALAEREDGRSPWWPSGMDYETFGLGRGWVNRARPRAAQGANHSRLGKSYAFRRSRV